jgi:hypothetical protein
MDIGKRLAGLSLILAVAGCTSETPGQAHSTNGVDPPVSSAPSTSRSRVGEAPPINSPELDLARFESRVCELLTPAQLAEFVIRQSGQTEDSVVGPACTWHTPDSTAGASINVEINTKAQGGWEAVYQGKRKWKFFEGAGEIGGYPAVHYDPASDGTEGICTTEVGARYDLTFAASVFVNVMKSPEYRNACSQSDRVASLVIENVKGSR